MGVFKFTSTSAASREGLGSRRTMHVVDVSGDNGLTFTICKCVGHNRRRKRINIKVCCFSIREGLVRRGTFVPDGGSCTVTTSRLNGVICCGRTRRRLCILTSKALCRMSLGGGGRAALTRGLGRKRCTISSSKRLVTCRSRKSGDNKAIVRMVGLDDLRAGAIRTTDKRGVDPLKFIGNSFVCKGVGSRSTKGGTSKRSVAPVCRLRVHGSGGGGITDCSFISGNVCVSSVLVSSGVMALGHMRGDKSVCGIASRRFVAGGRRHGSATVGVRMCAATLVRGRVQVAFTRKTKRGDIGIVQPGRLTSGGRLRVILTSGDRDIGCCICNINRLTKVCSGTSCTVRGTRGVSKIIVSSSRGCI